MRDRLILLSLLGIGGGLCLMPSAGLACQPIAMLESSNQPPQRRAAQTTQTPIAPSRIAQDLTEWQGQYSFIESSASRPAPMYMNYEMRVSLARCGWRSYITVNGHLTALDLQAAAVAIDDNTIGLYYQQDLIPGLQVERFKHGELLLRLQKTPASKPGKPANYRVYFEALEPLVPAHKQSGLSIEPPKSLTKP
ncbi:MAG: hypothetical protein RLZZ511_1914 [Cyanobacteriota bacterium]